MAFASINQASVGGGSSNALAIQSDGIFMPRLSTGQRTALALTAGDTGLTVYDFTLKNLFIWNGTAWESVPSSGDAGANGAVQYNDAGIVTGASNFVWDDVNNRVGIGTASPGGVLHTAQTAAIAYVSNIFENTSATGYVDLSLFVGASGANGTCSIRYAPGIFAKFGPDANDTTTPIYLVTNNGITRMEIAATGAGDVKINTGNVVMATSGKGIDFSAVTGGTGTATGNVLNDYEEGTWVGTLIGGTTNPTVPVTATGRYTKIGRVVTVQISFVNVNTTGASGLIQIYGLPFSNNGSIASVGGVTSYNLSTFTGSPFAFLSTSDSFLTLYANVSGAAFSDVNHSAGTGRYCTVSITYTVA